MRKGLTEVQLRLLRFCIVDPVWISLGTLQNDRAILRRDDVVAVPSLVELGLLEYDPDPGMVRIAYSGVVEIADERGRKRN